MKRSIIKKISISPLRASLIQPFRVATGQHDYLENILLTLELSDGTKGFGEAAVATHMTGETIPETKRNLRLVGQSLLGQDSGGYFKISEELHERLPKNKAAIAAIEMSLMDALTKQWEIPLWRFFGLKPQALVSDITIVIADLEETEAATKKFYQQGFRTFKVKIGRDFDLDLKRVLTVRRLTKNSRIILDANQGFTATEALRFIRLLKREGVVPVLIEQPVPKMDWAGLKRVTRLGGIAVCADETVSSFADAVKAIREKAVDAINIKLMKTGLFQARKIALLAKANGLKLMIGGMMESSLAMMASAHLAAGLRCFDFIDLDTPFFIAGGLKGNPFLSQQGIYNLKKVKMGIGIK